MGDILEGFFPSMEINNKNTLTYENIPIAITQITLTFLVYYDICPDF